MKRREFLKGLLVVVSVITVPALAKNIDKKWKTVNDSRVRESHISVYNDAIGDIYGLARYPEETDKDYRKRICNKIGESK